jgi:hypothetical protein
MIWIAHPNENPTPFLEKWIAPNTGAWWRSFLSGDIDALTGAIVTQTVIAADQVITNNLTQ